MPNYKNRYQAMLINERPTGSNAVNSKLLNVHTVERTCLNEAKREAEWYRFTRIEITTENEGKFSVRNFIYRRFRGRMVWLNEDTFMGDTSDDGQLTDDEMAGRRG